MHFAQDAAADSCQAPTRSEAQVLPQQKAESRDAAPAVRQQPGGWTWMLRLHGLVMCAHIACMVLSWQLELPHWHSMQPN